MATKGLRAILYMATVVEVGGIWWCEDCERRGFFMGGFRGTRQRRHYSDCTSLD